MHDFDQERDKRLALERTFRMNGRTFRYRPGVEPEVIARFEGVDELSGEDAVRTVDEVILRFLEPGQETEWQAARAPCENPVTLGDMVGLVKWLAGDATSGRPTEQSSGSSPSDGATTESSTDAAPSLAAVPSAT